jgi:hypothetical protein
LLLFTFSSLSPTYSSFPHLLFLSFLNYFPFHVTILADKNRSQHKGYNQGKGEESEEDGVRGVRKWGGREINERQGMRETKGGHR